MSRQLIVLGLGFVLAGCSGAMHQSRLAALGHDEEVGEMGPPPYEYIKIRGEGVPDWVPTHQRPEGGPASPLSWSVLGPRPIVDEYWSGNDDASGRVVSVAPHPIDPNVVYIGSASGGVWKTVDGGLNWTPLTDELSNLNHGVVALDPSSPDTVYAGTGEYTTGAGGDGLFRSTDGGATWTKLAGTGLVGSRFSSIIVDPTNSNRIHIAGQIGYARSDDGGATWFDPGFGKCSALVMKPGDPNTLLLGDHSDGIRRSTDGGSTWVMLNDTNGLPIENVSRILIAFAPSAPATAYTAILNGSNLNGFFVSTDSGLNWTELVNTPNFPTPQGWYDAFVGVDPGDADTVYCGGVFPTYAEAGVIKTTDGGVTWDDITISPTLGQLHPDQQTIAFGPSGTIWIGNDGGVWKSDDDGATWVNTNNTLTVTQNYTIAVNPQDPTFVMGGTQDNGTVERQAPGDDWPQILAGDGGFLMYDPVDPTRRYTTYVYLKVYRIVGGSVSNITGPWNSDPKNFIAPLVMDPNDPHTLLGGTNRVWRTNDAHSGATWTAISTSAVGAGGRLNAIAVGTGASNTIYTGSTTGKVYVTTDTTTWDDRSTGLPSGQIADIVLNPTNPATAYVSFHRTSGTRVLRTYDYGVNWTDVTGDLPGGVSARALAVDWEGAGPALFVGSGVGVYASLDGGATWIKDGSDLPNVNIGDLQIDTGPRVLYAGTYGRGAWKADLPDPGCTADLTGDGQVNVLDLMIILTRWGVAPEDPADLTHDGLIGVPDLLRMLAQWGPC